MQSPGLAAVALSVALLLCSANLAAAAPTSTPAVTSTLNFPEAEVDALARVIAALLDRPILVDPRVKGKISLYTEQPVTPAQAYALFSASLRGLGFAVVESAGLLKIVPEAEAKLQTGTLAASTAGDAGSADARPRGGGPGRGARRRAGRCRRCQCRR